MSEQRHQYARCGQCFRCGLTRPVEYLAPFHRVDTVLGIDEQVLVCTDKDVCARFRREREDSGQLAARKVPA